MRIIWRAMLGFATGASWRPFSCPPPIPRRTHPVDPQTPWARHGQRRHRVVPVYLLGARVGRDRNDVTGVRGRKRPCLNRDPTVTTSGAPGCAASWTTTAPEAPPTRT